MKLTLYHYWRSSSSWRVRWACALKELNLDYIAINLLDDSVEAPEHLKRNPMGYVPVLELTEPNGEKTLLAESLAIIEYLDETYPHPPLLPGSPTERARMRQLAEIINAGTQPLQNLNVTDMIFKSPDQDAEKLNWNQHWIRKGLTSYQTLIEPFHKKSAAKFSTGDQVSLPDLFLIPQCYNALRFKIDLKNEYPLLHLIYETALKTKACQESAPDRFEKR